MADTKMLVQAASKALDRLARHGMKQWLCTQAELPALPGAQDGCMCRYRRSMQQRPEER